MLVRKHIDQDFESIAFASVRRLLQQTKAVGLVLMYHPIWNFMVLVEITEFAVAFGLE